MRTLGRYRLHERIDLGDYTETWLASGPGRGGAIDPVRLSRLLPTIRGDTPWLPAQIARIEAARFLAPPWEQTWFIGEEGGETVHVRSLVFGAPLKATAVAAPLPISSAAWCGLELCRALIQARTLPFSCLGIDEHFLRVGWEGQLHVGGFDLDTVPTHPGELRETVRSQTLSEEEARGAPPTEASAVFRVCAVLRFLLRGLPAELGPFIGAQPPGCAALAAVLQPLVPDPKAAQAAMATLVRSQFALAHAIDVARLAAIEGTG